MLTLCTHKYYHLCRADISFNYRESSLLFGEGSWQRETGILDLYECVYCGKRTYECSTFTLPKQLKQILKMWQKFAISTEQVKMLIESM